MELKKLKQIIEAALMASGEVLSVERLQLLFDDYEKPKSPAIKQALESLMEDFSERGIELVEVASGYRLQVRKEVAPWVTRLWDEKPQRYSRALLETMSLIAYRQPITRGDIEDVRGVAVSSQIIRTLLDREWVRVVGHRDVPGRPAMYATTKEFLDYFSLKSLDELPSLDEIREMDDANQNLDLINAEKKASATREYDFDSEEDVATRGEEVLAETELELEEAQKLIDQVEDNVFNKPSEEELAAEREAEREAVRQKAEEERLAEENRLAEMANKTQQRLSSGLGEDDGPSSVDLADKIASHQARLSGINLESENQKPAVEGVVAEETVIEGVEELTLVQQQERLMQQLMQEEAQRQNSDQSSDQNLVQNQPEAVEPLVEASIDADVETEMEAEAKAEQELLEQEAAAERELMEQETLEQEQLEEELLEKEQLEKELLEKERLAEEALENELGLDDESLDSSSSENASNIKKNSLFDD